MTAGPTSTRRRTSGGPGRASAATSPSAIRWTTCSRRPRTPTAEACCSRARDTASSTRSTTAPTGRPSPRGCRRRRSTGSGVRTLRAKARPGLNRVTWDVRFDGPAQVELRALPRDNAHIWEEARFKGKNTRPISHWGIQGPEHQGPLALPGRYAVRLTLGGQTYTRPLEIVADPTILSSGADLAATTAMQVRIRDDMNETVVMINRLEV